jgi:serine/threonine-protein kinase PRP4
MFMPVISSILTFSTQEQENIPEITMVDEEALIEARRRKREAILAKYQGQSTPSLVDNLKLQSAEASPVPGSPVKTTGDSLTLQSSNVSDSPLPGSRDITPDFDAGDEKTFEFTSSEKDQTTLESREGPSAADYDPTDDMKLDNEKRHQHENIGQLDSADYDETKPTDQVILIPERTPPLPPQTPPQAADEDEDDMFATPVSPKSRPKSKEVIANKAAPVIEARQLDASMLDTWHDLEGYYIVILGEILNKRYVVQANLGKGMFSGVVRCFDNEQNGKPVAIKILRNNEAMRKAGLKEIGVLEKIMVADPDGRKHIIRFEGWFEHKGHLCLVFENLSLNLREVLKKFGRDVGINLKAVRAYAQQMFVGLSLLRKCNLLHADLKPDNILVLPFSF